MAFSIPKEYASLPHLVGRATVELTVEKADDSLAFVDRANGGLSKQGKVRGACGRVPDWRGRCVWLCGRGGEDKLCEVMMMLVVWKGRQGGV